MAGRVDLQGSVSGAWCLETWAPWEEHVEALDCARKKKVIKTVKTVSLEGEKGEMRTARNTITSHLFLDILLA